ncbi:MAG: ribonuclease R [Firmicutes bacterium]|nr:ribonuclease R [Bacillota bacterium]
MGKKKKKRPEVYTGTIEKHAKGFGFVRQEEGEDIFIGPSNMNGAMNGDLVEVDLLPPYLWNKSKEGIVTRVLERNYEEVVGTFQKNKKFGFVVSDDKKNPDDVFIKKEFFKNAQDGDKVVAKIIKYPDNFSRAEGKITQVIAKAGEVGSDISALIRSRGLFETFPSRVNAEAKFLFKQGILPEELNGRLDLRDKKIFTIDGPTAKDLDDAVSIEKLENGNYLLGVHIADVSHYVKEDSNLDKEALKRGTSIYLVNRVVPMLPKLLSNGICSLNPQEDRLTLSCIMEIDEKGEVVNHTIDNSVIRSCARLVYDDVSDILEKDDKELSDKYAFILEEIKEMGQLADILRRKRKQQGSLDFDLEEAVIEVDEEENPVRIEVEPRRTANRLIEEFMLIANETVAEHFFWMDIPFVYRVHESPDGEKITELRNYLSNFGITLKGSPDNVHPKMISTIIDGLEGKPYEAIVSRVILRTMKKAYYDTSCEGHFGLAFKYYCHFTSPIRRYPDLIIHRMIKAVLSGSMDEAKTAKYRMDTEFAAEQSSVTERQAQELEREVEKLKKAQYMQQHIGEEFDGIVSGITEFGVYVELANTIEGMAFAKDLTRAYQLGEKVRIQVLDARPEDRQIDFRILRDSTDNPEDNMQENKDNEEQNYG